MPFYVALPTSTIDWTVNDGVAEIPIEERAGAEVTVMRGKTAQGEIAEVQITPDGSPACNFGFDVTPGAAGDGADYGEGRLPGERTGHASLARVEGGCAVPIA